MNASTELWQLSATDLAKGYSTGRFTPIDGINSCRARMEQVDKHLNAFVYVDFDAALKTATESSRRWREGKPLSPLDGVPISIKDNINVAGMPTVWGSKLFGNYVPAHDELPVARLRKAGAVLLGKTNVPEFTLQGYTDNLVFGPTRNPWNLELTPGGSSGGAVAAVAAGMGPIALGTDGGGSIRRPSSHTGLAGLKPSIGRVPRSKGLPVILHENEVIGPIARTVEDLECVMKIIGSYDPEDPLSRCYRNSPYAETDAKLSGRILYIETFNSSPAVDPEIQQSVHQAAQQLAALGHDVEHCATFTLADSINEIVWPVIGQTGLAWLLQAYPDWEKQINPSLIDMAVAGQNLSATAYLNALDEIRITKQNLSVLFEEYDFLMTPSAAALPWPATEIYPTHIAGTEVGPRGHAVFTAFVNAAGLPGLNLPGQPAQSGLPIGFQLVGPQGSDARLCAIGRAYEAAHPWALHWPELPAR